MPLKVRALKMGSAVYFWPQVRTWGLVGSELPHQGWSLRPLQGKCGLSHRTAERAAALLVATEHRG